MIIISGNANNSIVINGKQYVAVNSDEEIIISVNGEEVCRRKGSVRVTLAGNVNSVEGTSFVINGNVSGDVDGTNITCGHVGGNVDGTNIRCGAVNGRVDGVNVRVN